MGAEDPKPPAAPRSARGVDLCEAVTRVCVPAYLRGLRLSDRTEEL